MERERSRHVLGPLLRTGPFVLRGATLEARIYQARDRTSGRHILLHDAAGKLVYDGEGAYDMGNALNRLEWWIAETHGPDPELRKRFEAGYVPTMPANQCMTRTAYERWLKQVAEAKQAEEAALTEAAARQMRCDDCDHAGTDANPLVPVEDTAAHPEGMVHGGGCDEFMAQEAYEAALAALADHERADADGEVDARPHAEDAHADHAPVG